MSQKIQEEIGKISKQLMYKEPFYGLFLIGLNKEISTRIPTGGVSKNGINCQLTINPDFWVSLRDIIKEGLLKHELLHIAFMHLNLRDKYSDKKLFNIAADIEINQYIATESIGEGWLLPSTYPDLNLGVREGTDSYYKKLMTAKQNGHPKLLQTLAGMEGTWSDHSTWDEFDNLSEAEKDLIKRQIDYQLKEIANYMKSRGHIPGELKAYIESLYVQKPAVFNWKEYLRRHINASTKTYTKKTRRKYNKRYPGNPALRIKTKGRILVAIDTSGSVSVPELLDFFSEIYHIWKCGMQVDIVECDAKMHPPYEYKGKFPGKIHGRGGTNFQPVIDFYDEHRKEYNTCVYFTDGECSAPTKSRNPMLWVISSNVTDNGREWFKDLPWYKFIIPVAT